MGEEHCRIEKNPTHGEIRVIARGFWTIDTLDAFVSDMRAAIATCRSRSRPLAVLIDATAMRAQSTAFGDRAFLTWQSLIDQPSDRAAIVVTSTLATLQFRRLYENELCRVFDSVGAADAWLARQSGDDR